MPKKKVRRTPAPRKKGNTQPNNYKIYYWITGIILIISLIFLGRTTLMMYYYLIKEQVTKSNKESSLLKKRSQSESLKIEHVLNQYYGNAFGIDVSRHQGKIIWDSVNNIKDGIPISFVLVRATRGTATEDEFFDRNWKKIKEKQILRGAYHYFDVNKNSSDQAENFIQKVKLEKGDFPPILDVEDLPKEQSLALLKKGILNWLNIIENHYKSKPIIYSNDAYFIHHIPDLDLSNYPIWIANYNWVEEPLHERWSIWQFTEKGIIKGIKYNFVDLNVFNGNESDLKDLTLK